MNEQEAAAWSLKLSALAGWRARPEVRADAPWTVWAQASPDGGTRFADADECASFVRAFEVGTDLPPEGV